LVFCRCQQPQLQQLQQLQQGDEQETKVDEQVPQVFIQKQNASCFMTLHQRMAGQEVETVEDHCQNFGAKKNKDLPQNGSDYEDSYYEIKVMIINQN
jgi:hypothetical protein